MRAEPSEFREIFRQCLKTGEILTDRRRDVCPWIARKGKYHDKELKPHVHTITV